MSKNDKVVAFEHIEIDDTKMNREPDRDNLFLIPTRELVLFPGVTFPITLGREMSVRTAEMAEATHMPIGIVCQIDSHVEEPVIGRDIYEVGVLADVLKIFELPDGPKTAIVRARQRFRILGPSLADTGDFLTARVSLMRTTKPRSNKFEFTALAEAIKQKALDILNMTYEGPSDLVHNIENCPDNYLLVNIIATHAPIKPAAKQAILEANSYVKRAYALLEELEKNEQLLNITREIHERTKQAITEQQRISFLQQQMEIIRSELQGDDSDAAIFKNRAEEVDFPEAVRTTFDREVDKLSRLNPQSPDYSVQYSYLDLLLNLPWNKIDPLSTSLNEAEEILNADHYGLEKVKERILEQLAILMNTPDGKSPIICLVGAPGVGKTSLGQSIAKALGRKYQRISLGGLHDEAELRGHRRTYIGAMPGRIIDAMRRAGSSNPVILLDEIDKIGNDMRGDPAAAMLEILDPEQNNHFHDNYVDVDYDLSKVLFIATANTLTSISQPLLDRMEVIDISGYLLEEKVEIATRHLLPRMLKENNLTKEEFYITRDAISEIIEGYTSESGVRQLEKKIAAIVRKTILKKMSGKYFSPLIMPCHLSEYLGARPYSKDRYEGNNYAGVVTGLAWTSVGGEILFVESLPSRGKGEKLSITGNLGDVMKESAVIALQYVKAHGKELGIPDEIFEKYSIHIHVPEGAIPKDGPSAGVTMVTSIVSALTRRRVRDRVAMTGEITLRGRVLPVGGIKEKILAAKRAGFNHIILPDVNRKDIEEIPARYLEGLKFEYVTDIKEVINIALLPETVDEPLPIE